jgi:N-acetylglutamate synthase
MPSTAESPPAAAAAEIRALEEVGYRLWVAPEVEEHDGWRLRAGGGMTGRANSVFPNREGALPLAGRIEHVEEWYAARGLAARFQLTRASLPPGLADALAGRGYRIGQAPSSVQVAPLPPLVADESVELLDAPDDRWVELWAAGRGFDDLDLSRALLTGGADPAAFARLSGAAIGRAVACDGWLGITSMLTVPAARRRGLGRAIVSSLVAWGAAHGCTRGLLQVERANVPARALYESLGFRERYEYSYAVSP